jgi:regulatory protein
MKITAIKAQAKKPERISVFVDNKYSFSLSQSQLLEYKIHSGLKLTEVKLAELKRASDYGKLLERAINYCLIRPRSIREVRDYLWHVNTEPATTESLISRLQDRGYLNDANFTVSWMRSRQLTKPVSKLRLAAELRQKGITQDMIDSAFSSSDYNETEALQEVIAKKRKLPRYQNEQKLITYLARQGYDYEDIKLALRQKNTPA